MVESWETTTPIRSSTLFICCNQGRPLRANLQPPDLRIAEARADDARLVVKHQQNAANVWLNHGKRLRRSGALRFSSAATRADHYEQTCNRQIYGLPKPELITLGSL